jgi:hypothetical protein
MHFACYGDIEQVLARHNHLEIVLAPMMAAVVDLIWTSHSDISIESEAGNAFVTLHPAVYVRWVRTSPTQANLTANADPLGIGLSR